MEVVSVNVADVRTLQIRGRAVRTGIFKLPTERRVAVGEIGLEGDVQVDRRVHGGRDQAVYAYAIEDVRWWEAELGRELGPGFFGENLTVRGIDVSGARLGERWELPGLALEVTAPRLPCQKIATKVGERGFARRFAKAGRPGAYLRVVREGEVGAGDAIAVVPAEGEHPTVAELAPS